MPDYDSTALIENIDRIHSTALGTERIKRNLEFDVADVVEWCKQKIKLSDKIMRKGKNRYVYIDDAILTINVHSYTIITAHKKLP